ncbi:hypothetical protein DFH05DRAFT_1016659 [Lentinula detonsa]|uniref:Uncharacterized protein n=1 Tax=Lentinula detonsa TaxID=2804962 RepID=A0A9W8P291_9AGAR|nr:hypothetical protein DFH05DRAFT_1016659 [Lentinula detonsa]
MVFGDFSKLMEVELLRWSLEGSGGGVRYGLWSLWRFWRVWSRDDDNKEYEGDEHKDAEHEEDDEDEDYEHGEDVRCNRPSISTLCGTFIHSSNAGRFARIFMLSSNILRAYGMPERSRSQCLLEVHQPILHGLASHEPVFFYHGHSRLRFLVLQITVFSEFPIHNWHHIYIISPCGSHRTCWVCVNPFEDFGFLLSASNGRQTTFPIMQSMYFPLTSRFVTSRPSTKSLAIIVSILDSPA